MVIINGGYRTGSTLAYNLAGRLAELSGIGIRKGGIDGAALDKILNQEEGSVYKTHNWKPVGEIPPSISVIYTHRDMKDCIASVLTIRPDYPQELIKPLVENQCALTSYMLRNYKGHERVLVIAYEQFHADAVHFAAEIASFLKLNLPDAIISSVGHEWSVPEVKRRAESIISMEPKTELRKGHVSKFNGENGYWREVLDDQMINMIDETQAYYQIRSQG